MALPDIKPLENIHLHHNIKIKGEIWRRAMALKKPSLFVSMISKEIWTAEELKQKCVKKSKKTAGRLEQLSPQKKGGDGKSLFAVFEEKCRKFE